MKISESWLRAELPQLTQSAEEIGHILTMAGLELDGLSTVAPPFSGVVVGQVISCTQHPDADKLRVTSVDVGADEPLQIVCGAPNVRTGLKVAVALIGAVLPSEDDKGFKIKKGKLRGVESFGMLCGASELGLTDEIDGLLELDDDAPIGTDIREYLGLDNHIFDIAITPNRGDCLSVRGIVRELFTLTMPKTSALHCMRAWEDKKTIDTSKFCQWHDQIKALDTPITPQAVIVQEPDACPRYFAQPVHGIDRSVPTPKWLKDRLIHSGLRTHNFLVDVTNYVLLELGQPLHAFDADKIVGDIVVRLGKQGESFELLNEQTITLMGDELVIADDAGVLALAGIMGGKRSAVTDDTKNIVLESAYFERLAIASRARRFGLHTDASQRFERGIDAAMTSKALDRAITLITEYAGGELGTRTIAQTNKENYFASNACISISTQQVQKLLGIDISHDEIMAILATLDISVISSGDEISCTVPSYRYDLTITQDIIEEIARIYGYDNIPVKLPQFVIDMKDDDATDLTYRIKQKLASAGYFEAVSFSFSDAKTEALFNDDKLGAVLPLLNPISADLAVMRRTLLSSLLPIVSHNLKRQQPCVRLFETGLSFIGQSVDKLAQTPSLTMVATATTHQGLYQSTKMDFFDLKGDIENLLPAHLDKANVRYERADLAFLHPHQSAYLYVNDKKLGWFGQLHPSISSDLELGTLWVAELKLDALLELYHEQNPIHAPSKFPSVRRDLAFLVASDTSWQALSDDIYACLGAYLTDLTLFDVYQGDRLPAGKKSLAFSMTLQDTHATLDDDTIKTLMEKVINTISQNHNAQLRDS